MSEEYKCKQFVLSATDSSAHTISTRITCDTVSLHFIPDFWEFNLPYDACGWRSERTDYWASECGWRRPTLQLGADGGDERGEAVAEALVDVDVGGRHTEQQLEQQGEGRLHVAPEHGAAAVRNEGEGV